MFESRKNGQALTLGAARARLIAGGYGEPISLVAPDASDPPWLVSEHAPGLRTLSANPLAALILTAPDDVSLAERIRAVLERCGLTRGPVRIGSDGCSLWPLRPTDTLPFEHSALDGAVLLVGNRWLGVGLGTTGSLIPLDGSWPRGDLLSTPYAKLPGISPAEAQSVFRELEALSPPPREEYVPPPVRRREPTASELELAEMRRDPEKLRKALHEYTGNPAMQQALLRSVREMPAGE